MGTPPPKGLETGGLETGYERILSESNFSITLKTYSHLNKSQDPRRNPPCETKLKISPHKENRKPLESSLYTFIRRIKNTTKILQFVRIKIRIYESSHWIVLSILFHRRTQ